jgi:hypothetical protein
MTLNAAIETAKAKAANSPKWIRAIERAAAGLQSGELVVTLLHNGALVTSPRGSYFVNGHCQCAAAQHDHAECVHRAAARITEMMEAEPETAPEPKVETMPAHLRRKGSRRASAITDGNFSGFTVRSKRRTESRCGDEPTSAGLRRKDLRDFMNENNNDLKTNQLDSVQTSLVCLVESEAEEMLTSGQNQHAKRILDACHKPFRWGTATRGQLTEFGNLIWVHPDFWCKPDFLLFIMNEYQAAKLRIIGKRIFLIIVDKFILQFYRDNVSLRNKPPNAKFTCGFA